MFIKSNFTLNFDGNMNLCIVALGYCISILKRLNMKRSIFDSEVSLWIGFTLLVEKKLYATAFSSYRLIFNNQPHI